MLISPTQQILPLEHRPSSPEEMTARFAIISHEVNAASGRSSEEIADLIAELLQTEGHRLLPQETAELSYLEIRERCKVPHSRVQFNPDSQSTHPLVRAYATLSSIQIELHRAGGMQTREALNASVHSVASVSSATPPLESWKWERLDAEAHALRALLLQGKPEEARYFHDLAGQAYDRAGLPHERIFHDIWYHSIQASLDDHSTHLNALEHLQRECWDNPRLLALCQEHLSNLGRPHEC